MLYMVTFTINIPPMLVYIYTIHGSYGLLYIIWYYGISTASATHNVPLFQNQYKYCIYNYIYIHVCRIVYLYHYQLITSQHLNISSAQAHKTPSKTKPELMASERWCQAYRNAWRMAKICVFFLIEKDVENSLKTPGFVRKMIYKWIYKWKV